MKPFETYQYLSGEEMTERDKTEVGSKFWNKGKWDNFVLPFLPTDTANKTIIDIGCNAGLFLNLAEETGFSRVIGVDSSEGAVLKGREWAIKNNKKYKILLKDMENCLDDLPMSDGVIMANVHYYFKINDWVNFLDKLKYKTLNCIVVTTQKRPGNRCWAQADLSSISSYFSEWKETGFIEELPTEGDPRPRRLWSLCYRSLFITKIPIKDLDSGNHVQDNFYNELDCGKRYFHTKYYRIIRKYRLEDRKDWNEEKLEQFFKDRVNLYNDIKENGLKNPILINKDNLILDGNHRCQMLKHLGYDEVFVRII